MRKGKKLLSFLLKGQINQLLKRKGNDMKKRTVKWFNKMTKEGRFECMTDPTPGRFVEVKFFNGRTGMMFVEHDDFDE